MEVGSSSNTGTTISCAPLASNALLLRSTCTHQSHEHAVRLCIPGNADLPEALLPACVPCRSMTLGIIKCVTVSDIRQQYACRHISHMSMFKSTLYKLHDTHTTMPTGAWPHG